MKIINSIRVSIIKYTNDIWPKLKRIPRKIWVALGAVGVILGIFFNLSLDLPDLLTKLSIIPTPLAFSSAKIDEGEVLVVVTNFTGVDGEGASVRIFRALSEQIKSQDLFNVRVEYLSDYAPVQSEEAISVGNNYNATLIIWGTADGHGIEPRYEVVQYKELIKELPDLGVILANDPPTFSTYIVERIPQEYKYLLLFSVGQIAFFSGEYEKADGLLTNALEINLGERSNDLSLDVVYFYRGSNFESWGKTSAALADYTKAIEINPDKAELYEQRAELYLLSELSEKELAFNDYNRAIELGSQNASVYNSRSVLYRWVYENKQAAIADLKEAIEIDSTFFNAYYNLANIYYSEGKYEEALNEMDLGIENANYEGYSSPERSEAFMYAARGRMLMDFGYPDEAIVDLTYAIELDPYDLSHFQARAVAYGRLEMYQEALDDLNYVIDKIPSGKAYRDRGVVFYELHQNELAITDLELAIEYNDTDEYAHYLLGRIYAEMEHYEKAITTWQRYVWIVGENADPDVVEELIELKDKYQ